MNKLTSTLAGLALVAGASIAPAFAQGAFSGPVTFSFTPSGFSVINQLVTYNPFGSATSSSGFLTLVGQGSGNVFTNTALSFTPSGSSTAAFTDLVPFTTIVPVGNGIFSIASVGATAKGDQYNLNAAPVPEASTVLSFGALLALGGLAVLRRKSAVKTAA